MFQKILIPVDGSACSERAAQVGLELAKRIGAHVVLTHALTYYATEEDGFRVLEPSRQRAEALGLNFETRFSEGRLMSVGDGIVDACQEARCDLIVMGTHGREGMQRLLLGSVAERVSRQAPVPVMLVRALERPAEAAFHFNRILVSVDGSAPSLLALSTAHELAQALGAHLEILNVIPDLPLMHGYVGYEYGPMVDYERYQKDFEAQSQAVVAAALAQAKADPAGTAEVSASRISANREHIGDVIAHTASAHRADLIVTGTHGHRGFDRLLLGSVAERVAHRAEVPVLLIRALRSSTQVPLAAGSSAGAPTTAAKAVGQGSGKVERG